MADGHTLYCGLARRQRVDKITVSGIPNCINYVIYTHLTNVAAGL